MFDNRQVGQRINDVMLRGVLLPRKMMPADLALAKPGLVNRRRGREEGGMADFGSGFLDSRGGNVFDAGRQWPFTRLRFAPLRRAKRTDAGCEASVPAADQLRRRNHDLWTLLSLDNLLDSLAVDARNALLANVGLEQVREGGRPELPLVTCGDDVDQITSFLPTPDAERYSAKDVVTQLLTGVAASDRGTSR